MSNSITVSGNLGKDSEVRFTKTGKAVTTLVVAHTPRLKTADGWSDGETIWFKVTVWDELPPLLFCKGQRVLVTGALSQPTWEKDGEKKSQLAIEASSVGIIHKGTIQSSNGAAPAYQPAANSWVDSVADSTPF